MKACFSQLPLSPGKKWTGKESAAPLKLEESGLSTVGPLIYTLGVESLQGKFSVTGSLTLDVHLRCVACLRTLPYRIQIDDFSVQLELANKRSADLTPFVREDILLALPSYPRCRQLAPNHPPCSIKLPACAFTQKKSDRSLSLLPAWRVLRNLTLK